MFDTICLRSPEIKRDLALYIEKECVKRCGIDCSTGEILYEITTGSLAGSYDNRVSVRVKDYAFKKIDNYVQKVSLLGKCVEVECSVNKLLFGHNVFGNDNLNDIQYCTKFLVKFLEDAFNVDLPNFLDWYIVRVDYAINYRIGEAIDDWFRQMNNIYYPRRKVIRNSLNGITFPGSTTVIKFYNKFDEFKVHDYKRLTKFGCEYAKKIKEFAWGVLRIEVEVKKRKFEYDLDKKDVTVQDIFDYDFRELFFKELQKIFKVGEEMKILNDSLSVEKRLKSKYGDSLGRILFGTWLQLTVFSYEKVRDGMSRTTFYRHVKLIRESGCNWHNADIEKVEFDNVIPVDFMFRSDYVVEECNIDKYAIEVS